MKTLLKITAIFSVIFIATSCASEKYFTYSGKEKIKAGNFKLLVTKVNVKLLEDRMLANKTTSKLKYPDAKQVSSIMQEVMQKSLRNVGLSGESENEANVLECEVDVNYARVFAVFSGDKYAGSALEGYKIRVYKHGKLVAEKEDKSMYCATQDAMGNLRKTSRTLSMTADASDEKIEITIFAQAIAKDVMKLGK